METCAIHLIIHGRVQGVGYRAWTTSRARHYGLTGWVRNRTDGTVEAAISGDAAKVEMMIADCHEGPLAARVTRVDSKMWDGEAAADFKSLPTN